MPDKSNETVAERLGASLPAPRRHRRLRPEHPDRLPPRRAGFRHPPDRLSDRERRRRSWPTPMRAITHRSAVVTAQNGPAATLLVPAARRGAEGVGADRRARPGRAARSNPTERLPGTRPPPACSTAAPNGCAGSTAPSGSTTMSTWPSRPRPAAGPGRRCCSCRYDLFGDAAGAGSRRARRSSAPIPLDRVVADPARIAEAADLLAARSAAGGRRRRRASFATRRRRSPRCRRPARCRSRPRPWARAPSTRRIRCRSA